jgi:hypothetical protein
MEDVVGGIVPERLRAAVFVSAGAVVGKPCVSSVRSADLPDYSGVQEGRDQQDGPQP